MGKNKDEEEQQQKQSYHDDECYSCFNIIEEWRSAYFKVLGIRYPPRTRKGTVTTAASTNNTTKSASGKIRSIRITNLAPLFNRTDCSTVRNESVESLISLYEEATGASNNSAGATANSSTRTTHLPFDEQWMKSALDIQSNLDQMAQWLEEKKDAFVSVEMSPEEASLIQSTATSFVATTANEIESLRQLIPRTIIGDSQLFHHRTAIVQILLGTLKERIAEPFGQLSKQRHRLAIQLWHHPLECRYVADGRLVKFLPTRPRHVLHGNFLDSYTRTAHQYLQSRDDTRQQRPVSSLLNSSKRTLSPSEELTKHMSDMDSIYGIDNFSTGSTTGEKLVQQPKKKKFILMIPWPRQCH